MIGELLFALIRIAFYFFVFYFIYRLIVGFFRVFSGGDRKNQEAARQPPPQPPQKPVQTYTDVADAKFKDLPPESKE